MASVEFYRVKHKVDLGLLKATIGFDKVSIMTSGTFNKLARSLAE